MAEKKVNIKLSADTKEAVRSVRDFERQVNKLGDLADQGERRQDGFLSPKQVQMYKRIAKEMEQTHSEHLKNLKKMDDEYSRQKNSAEAKKLKDLQDEVKKRDRMYKSSMGGNKWGDQATPILQEYHRTKLESAQQNLETFKKSDELKGHTQNMANIEANIAAMKQAVDRLADEQSRGNMHSGRINDLREMDPMVRHTMNAGMQTLASTGAVVGLGGYFSYTGNGIDLLREQERASGTVSLRSGAYDGVKSADGKHRKSIYDVGEENNYDTLQTAAIQSQIITGGTSGDMDALNKDTKAVQRFSKSYAMDPMEMANSGALLQRMGTFAEGEQQRFANMIAGAISKGGMNGRQEEMLRATVSLANSVSQGQAKFTEQQAKNVMGMQVALGNAVPELKGERGANLLAGMDSAIKNGGSQLDLLMGKGTKYTGMEGMLQLEMLKEQGLSNPENLQSVLQGADRMFGGNRTMTMFALKEQLGLQLNEYEALEKSGLLEKIKEDPHSVTQQDLAKAGADELSKQWGTYSASETGEVDYLDSQAANLQGSHAQGADQGAKTMRGLWHGMPDWMQHGLLPLGAFGGGFVASKFGGRMLSSWLQKKIKPTIGGKGGWQGLLGKFGKGGGGTPPVPPVPPTGGNGAGTILNSADDLAEAGAKNASWGSKFAKGAGGLLKGAGKAIPIAGAVISTGIDQATTDNSFGKSLSKGIGGAIGGLLGIAGGTALGIGTGGLGFVGLGALGVGGGMAGEKVGEKIYDFFSGEGGKKEKETTEALPVDGAVPTASASGAEVDSLTVNSFKVNDQQFANYFSKDSSNKTADAKFNARDSEHTVRVVLEGDVKGMDKEDQGKIADSVKDHFANLVSPYSNNPYKYNLSYDQYRT